MANISIVKSGIALVCDAGTSFVVIDGVITHIVTVPGESPAIPAKPVASTDMVRPHPHQADGYAIKFPRRHGRNTPAPAMADAFDKQILDYVNSIPGKVTSMAVCDGLGVGRNDTTERKHVGCRLRTLGTSGAIRSEALPSGYWVFSSLTNADLLGSAAQ